MASNILDWLQGNREKLKLLGYFLLVIVLAIPVSGILATGYSNANLVRAFLRLRYPLDIELASVAMLAIGTLLGLLVLMVLDQKKRVQALLLLIGTFIGVLVVSSQGLLLSNISLVGNIHWVGIGILIGMALGGGEKLLDFDQPPHRKEFRRASQGVYFLIALITILSFLEAHVTYPHLFQVTREGVELRTIQNSSFGIVTDGLLFNTLAAGGFLFIANRFITYDANKNFFILGPRGSGKSLFLIGAYLQALDRMRDSNQATPLNPSQDLMAMVEQLDRDTNEWIVESTGRGEVNILEFQWVQGSVFPTNINISGVDYAGEYLERLPDALTGVMDDNDMDATMKRLVEGIETSDTLLLLVDIERFVEGRPLEITEYFSILQSAGDKNVILIATKADHLAEDFEDERGLAAHRYFEDFTEYTNQRLRQNENINSLITQVGSVDICPVYYQTKTNENGNRVPMRDDTGSVVTVGFEQLLKKLGRS